MSLRLREKVQALLPLTAKWANDLYLPSLVNALKLQLRLTKLLKAIRSWPITAPHDRPQSADCRLPSSAATDH